MIACVLGEYSEYLKTTVFPTARGNIMDRIPRIRGAFLVGAVIELAVKIKIRTEPTTYQGAIATTTPYGFLYTRAVVPVTSREYGMFIYTLATNIRTIIDCLRKDTF
jgi:hypothetical protein